MTTIDPMTVEPRNRGGGERGGRRLRTLVADADPFARRVTRDALQEADGIIVIATSDPTSCWSTWTSRTWAARRWLGRSRA
jgi:hypothetical protein